MDKKELRKQIRNVLESDGAPEAIKIALAQAEKLNADRLDVIEKNCMEKLDAIHADIRNQLGNIEKKNGMFQAYLIGQVKGDIQAMIAKNEDAISACIEILAEAGIGPSDLTAKIEARIPEVRKKKSEDAAAAMTKRLEDERAASEGSHEQAAT